jgi:hypothetical protein
MNVTKIKIKETETSEFKAYLLAALGRRFPKAEITVGEDWIDVEAFTDTGVPCYFEAMCMLRKLIQDLWGDFQALKKKENETHVYAFRVDGHHRASFKGKVVHVEQHVAKNLTPVRRFIYHLPGEDEPYLIEYVFKHRRTGEEVSGTLQRENPFVVDGPPTGIYREMLPAYTEWKRFIKVQNHG